MRPVSMHSRLVLQRGVSLIELMVALVGGLILMGGMLQVYSGNKQVYRLQDSQGRLQENARLAFELLTRSIREAGYRGCSVSTPLTSTLTGTLVSTDPTGVLIYHPNYLYSFDIGLQGAEWTGGTATTITAANWTPTRDASIGVVRADGSGTLVPGSDIITIRGALNNGVPLSATMAAVTADIPAAAGNGIALCDLVMVTNCSTASIAQVTATTATTTARTADNPAVGETAAGDPARTLAHAASGGTCTETSNASTALAAAYGPTATVVRYGTTSYYIAQGSSTNSAGTREPSLFRRVDGYNAEEMVEGIEQMQILYGEDDPPAAPAVPDYTPNRYVTANRLAAAGVTLSATPSATEIRNFVTAWHRVVGVRISLVVRSAEELAANPMSYRLNGVTYTPADRRLRQVFTTTIGLRNGLQ